MLANCFQYSLVYASNTNTVNNLTSPYVNIEQGTVNHAMLSTCGNTNSVDGTVVTSEEAFKSPISEPILTKDASVIRNRRARPSLSMYATSALKII